MKADRLIKLYKMGELLKPYSAYDDAKERIRRLIKTYDVETVTVLLKGLQETGFEMLLDGDTFKDLINWIITAPAWYMSLFSDMKKAKKAYKRKLIYGLKCLQTNGNLDRVAETVDAKELADAVMNMTVDATGISEDNQFGCFAIFPYVTTEEFLSIVGAVDTYHCELEKICSGKYRKETIHMVFEQIPNLPVLDTDAVLTIMSGYERDPKILEFLTWMNERQVDFQIFNHSDFLGRLDHFDLLPALLEAIPNNCMDYVLHVISYSMENMRITKRVVRMLGEMDEEERSKLFEDNCVAGIFAKLLDKEWILPYLSDQPSTYPYYNTENVKSVLLHALLHNKKAFLRLCEQGTFSNGEIQYLNTSLEYIRRHVNLNAWSEKELKNAVIFSIFDGFDDDDRAYTYKEAYIRHQIFLLQTYEKERELKSLFDKLLGKLSLDASCVRMQQYINADVDQLAEKDVETVANALAEHDLPKWRELLFRFKASLHVTAAALPYVSMQNVLKEAETEAEILFIADNAELCRNGLEEGRENLLENDRYVMAIRNHLEDVANDDFWEKYHAEILQFFVNGNGILADKYLENLYDTKLRRKFLIVLKAALGGKLNELRYTGLEQECGMSIPENVKKIWMKDEQTGEGNLTIYEDTSFHSIMTLGEKPIRTCMNYIDGGHRECLLSYFDGNKKVVYIKKEDKVLARAVIRLTRLNGNASGNVVQFTDVTETSTEAAMEPERSIIFLERMYSGVQGTGREVLERSLIKFVKEKAERAGIRCVISQDYEDTLQSGELSKLFTKRRVGVYITRSKAGIQYLDSLGGETEEGNLYYPADCYVEMK